MNNIGGIRGKSLLYLIVKKKKKERIEIKKVSFLPQYPRYFCYGVQQERNMLCKIKTTCVFGVTFYD